MTLESTPTDTLAEFAAGISHGDLPEKAREHARNLLLDSVACALAADFGDETKTYADYARAAGGTGATTVIGSPERLSLLGATLLNGYQITAATVCDTYVPAHVHICPEIVPPALAIAERDGLDGKALLTAVAVGAEVAVRVAAGIDYKVSRGWHMPGIVGPFGASAAVGRLLGLTPLQMRNAFGLAGSQSAGTWASWGTPAVKFHQSRGAASGLMAALLAQQDFKSSANILTHPDGGTLSAYSDGGKPEAITAGLGERYEFEEISLRLWPGGTPLQPTLTAVFDLLAAHKPAFGEIERVRIEVAPAVYEAHARFDKPKGTFEALLSYPFVVSSALRDGRFWLTSLETGNNDDQELASFMAERVELAANAGLTPESSNVSITMADGRNWTIQADAAKGTRRNPATLADLRTKYQHCTAGRLGEAQAAELLDLLVRVDELDNLGRLFELLGSAGDRQNRLS